MYSQTAFSTETSATITANECNIIHTAALILIMALLPVMMMVEIEVIDIARNRL